MFELKGGSWQMLNLPGHGGFTGVPVAAVGNDLRETLPIRQAGDTLCSDNRGTQTRLWHWNGTAFRPGPWSYKRKKTAPQPAQEVVYTSPSLNIECSMFDNARSTSVYCQTFDPPASSWTAADG
jgi:hypothetical protein